MDEFFIGGTIGAALAIVLMAAIFAFVSAGNNPKIETCRQEHNVYQCELVAVPVAAPSWVQK